MIVKRFSKIDDISEKKARKRAAKFLKKRRSQLNKYYIEDNVEKLIDPVHIRNKMYEAELRTKNKILEHEKRDVREAYDRIKSRNLKKAGKIGLGALAVAGTAYGGKRLYDHYKDKKI